MSEDALQCRQVFRGKGREAFFLVAVGQRRQRGHEGLALGCQRERLGAPVFRIGAARHQTDLFVLIENLLQGDRHARMKLDQAPLSLGKICRKGLTHAAWLLIALCTGGAWVFYFVDAPTLLDQLRHFDVSWMTGGWILGLTASTYLMAGYAREQVCTYMCPYARFQSAMFDKDTLIIGYDRERGEPRGKHKAGTSWEGKGHCIDCTQCVMVCPMGIDIRDGLQMECIACGLCVDACNGVMDKLSLPRGLIRYDTARNYEQRLAAHENGESHKPKTRILRPRTYWYMAIIAILSALMLFAFFSRTSTDISVIHDRNPLFVTLSDGSIRNTYTVRIINKTHEDHVFSLKVGGMEAGSVAVVGAGNPAPDDLHVLADSVASFRVMITAQKQPQSRREITMAVASGQGLAASMKTIFISGDQK